MTSRRSSAVPVLLAALLLVCLGAAAAGLAAGILPDQLASLGPADPSLEPVERWLLTAYLVLYSPRLGGPLAPDLGQIELTIEPGSSARQVAASLESLGLVDDPELFVRYLHYRGLDTGIEAGRYTLDGSMALTQVAQALQSAEAAASTLTVPEGWRREQVADLLDRSQLAVGGEAFLAASLQLPAGHWLEPELPPAATLEGYLFPDSYQLAEDTSAEELVAAMLDNFTAKLTPVLRRAFADRGLNVHQAVTLASIVEREAAVAEEMPQIASVFLNRLALGMKLDADPTVQFALGRQSDGGWWKAGLTFADLEIDSPFNTYRFAGLPPGPIANPGLASLEAVAQPTETVYLFFRAACDGSGRHLFAVTFEEHQANACD